MCNQEFLKREAIVPDKTIVAGFNTGFGKCVGVAVVGSVAISWPVHDGFGFMLGVVAAAT